LIEPEHHPRKGPPCRGPFFVHGVRLRRGNACDLSLEEVGGTTPSVLVPVSFGIGYLGRWPPPARPSEVEVVRQAVTDRPFTLRRGHCDRPTSGSSAMGRAGRNKLEGLVNTSGPRRPEGASLASAGLPVDGLSPIHNVPCLWRSRFCWAATASCASRDVALLRTGSTHPQSAEHAVRPLGTRWADSYPPCRHDAGWCSGRGGKGDDRGATPSNANRGRHLSSAAIADVVHVALPPQGDSWHPGERPASAYRQERKV
jgi:hypothetical protein